MHTSLSFPFMVCLFLSSHLVLSSSDNSPHAFERCVSHCECASVIQDASCTRNSSELRSGRWFVFDVVYVLNPPCGSESAIQTKSDPHDCEFASRRRSVSERLAFLKETPLYFEGIHRTSHRVTALPRALAQVL